MLLKQSSRTLNPGLASASYWLCDFRRAVFEPVSPTVQRVNQLSFRHSQFCALYQTCPELDTGGHSSRPSPSTSSQLTKSCDMRVPEDSNPHCSLTPCTRTRVPSGEGCQESTHRKGSLIMTQINMDVWHLWWSQLL